MKEGRLRYNGTYCSCQACGMWLVRLWRGLTWSEEEMARSLQVSFFSFFFFMQTYTRYMCFD